jgi:RHS repeat-associated protein
MAYDADGELTNIIEHTTSQFPISFYALHYNLAGRSDWEFKGPMPHAFVPPTRTMTYDADNRLASFNGTNVTVDSDGNLTYGPLTNGTFGTYAYDARNELTSAGGLTYGYDPTGNRTSLTNGSTNTTFIVNPQGSQTLMRIKNGTTNYYIYGTAGLVYEIDETATTTNTAFYHFDSRGSTVALTDGSGNLTDQIEYSPYGTTTYRLGTTDTPFCYNGEYGVQTDPNGLLYMRARYFNPYISRFLNPDPSAFAGGLNFYAFADGNPISQIDPFGLGFWSVTGHFIEGAVIGAGVAIVVVIAAPEIVAGGAAALVWAGVEAATATTVASATVTAGLGATALVGGVATGINTYNNAAAGNWDAVAFNVGTLAGGTIVGVSGGGKALAEGISGQETSAKPGLFGDNDLGYDSDYPGGSILGWLGSGPTPQSGGGAAALTAAGVGLFLQPSSTPNSTTSQSSPIGK